ncbi:MAG: HEPN domain-containing protein [Candidatus Omnitrophica bacterium]|nr:HEPN domain-containing protein [Candidatus Omnitrophota bacterium]
MNFKELQKQNLIEKYQVTPHEINSIIEAAKNDIKTAQNLLNVDTCWAFNIAYNCLLEASLALMYSKGFRPIGEAKHVSIILFLKKILGKNYQSKIERFNQMRRKRHKAVYGILRNITEYEAKEAVKFATEFLEEIIKRIYK